MRTTLGFIIFGIIMMGLSVSAQETSAREMITTSFTSEGELETNLYPTLSRVNTDLRQLPTPVLTLFGNQRIRVDLTLSDGTRETLGIVTNANSIRTITRYAPRDATMGIKTDEETIKRIAFADDKAGMVIEAVNTGRLTYGAIRQEATIPTVAADVTVLVSNIWNTFARIIGY